MNQTERATTELAEEDLATRLRRIRDRLPGQLLRERIELAAASYGPLYTLAEVRQKVSESLPRRLGFVRGASIEPIEDYREQIPEWALIRYDDAYRTGLFSRFWVATPRYFEQRQVDPWILGEVAGTQLYAVVAQWS